MSALSLSAAATDTTLSPKAKPKRKTASRPATAGSKAPKTTKPTGPKTPAGSQTKKSSPKPARKALSKAKVSKAKVKRRPAPAVKSKTAPQQVVRNWTAYFVYAGATGSAKVAILRIRARNGERAREVALKAPPGEEFMLTIMPESDEQFLGQVRLKAISAAENRA